MRSGNRLAVLAATLLGAGAGAPPERAEREAKKMAKAIAAQPKRRKWQSGKGGTRKGPDPLIQARLSAAQAKRDRKAARRVADANAETWRRATR